MTPIVGIGELLWDVYPDGHKVAGGAPFNFAFHCHQLGHPAAIVSRVGDDDLGRELREEVRRLGLSDDFIQTDRDHPTGTVRVTLDDNKVPTYAITENVAWDWIEWNERLARVMLDAPASCFGSLVHRAFRSAETVRRLIANAYGFLGTGGPFDMLPWIQPTTDDIDEKSDDQPASCKVIVCDINLRAHYYTRETLRQCLRESTWWKLNEHELAVLVGMFEIPWASDSAALRAFRQRDGFGKDTICLTRGNGGSLVQRVRYFPDSRGVDSIRQEEEFEEPAVPARVVDTVGAGDAFTAAMVCLHLEGRPLRDCARFANHYAARVCEDRGATPRIDRADVERAAFGTT